MQLTKHDGKEVVIVHHIHQRLARNVLHGVAVVNLKDPIEYVILLDFLICNESKSIET